MRLFDHERAAPMLYEERRRPYGNLEQMFAQLMEEELDYVPHTSHESYAQDQAEPKRFLLDTNPDSDYREHMSMNKNSQLALASIQPVLPNMREQVFACIAGSLYGMTDDEVEVALDMRHQTASARRRELVKAGRVRDTGRRRNTRSGRPATVWEAL